MAQTRKDKSGRIHTFPDDASEQEMNEAMGMTPPNPPGAPREGQVAEKELKQAAIAEGMKAAVPGVGNVMGAFMDPRTRSQAMNATIGAAGAIPSPTGMAAGAVLGAMNSTDPTQNLAATATDALGGRFLPIRAGGIGAAKQSFWSNLMRAGARSGAVGGATLAAQQLPGQEQGAAAPVLNAVGTAAGGGLQSWMANKSTVPLSNAFKDLFGQPTEEGLFKAKAQITHEIANRVDFSAKLPGLTRYEKIMKQLQDQGFNGPQSQAAADMVKIIETPATQKVKITGKAQDSLISYLTGNADKKGSALQFLSKTLPPEDFQEISEKVIQKVVGNPEVSKKVLQTKLASLNAQQLDALGEKGQALSAIIDDTKSEKISTTMKLLIGKGIGGGLGMTGLIPSSHPVIAGMLGGLGVGLVALQIGKSDAFARLVNRVAKGDSAAASQIIRMVLSDVNAALTPEQAQEIQQQRQRAQQLPTTLQNFMGQ